MAEVLNVTEKLETSSGSLTIHGLNRLGTQLGAEVSRLPHTVKILLENLTRRSDSNHVRTEDIAALASWPEESAGSAVAFMPARVLMQDFTGVPAVVDLAALRTAVAKGGGDPEQVNPFIPVDLIIDHSVQVDAFGEQGSYSFNIKREYERNEERYSVLRWAQQAFKDFSVVPPGMGICHQVNLEHLGRVVQARDGIAFPDTVVGMDSHTPMINGLGVLGWGVGGIEAEAAMLGQPLLMTAPIVVGVKTTGRLRPGTTATDLVLTLAYMLRAHGVVGKFVEFYGSGLSALSVADRATISNMSPEFGATASLFPVDDQTLKYLRDTNRPDAADLAERYTKAQGLFRNDDDPDPVFSEALDLDLSAVRPSMAGPRRPQDRSELSNVWTSFVDAFKDQLDAQPKEQAVEDFKAEGGNATEPKIDPSRKVDTRRDPVSVKVDGVLKHGSVVIAAITSCTNTSNPTVMIAAGLLAKKAVEAGLETKPWVKTSLAPGSRVVTQYLDRAGLVPYLDKLGFNLVGYGCTTCIGNSGPLPDAIANAVDDKDLVVAAVLSGNRNFEGRIHPQVRASYLASPPLCVAYALAGSLNIDLTKDPLGKVNNKPIYLRDIWPSSDEVNELIASSTDPKQFEEEYGRIYDGDENWAQMPSPEGRMYEWTDASTYIQNPPFFEGVTAEAPPIKDIENARVLVKAGNSITTDHISPAGGIKAKSPAGEYLQKIGVGPRDFNSYGSRRGNHHVMLRGTFANVRFRNELAGGKEGPWTKHFPSGDEMTVFDASARYMKEETPLIVLAGAEYGTGSSRDWAAKGTYLLGVKAVIAQSFERIHRSNLIGMGVLPLEFKPGESPGSLGLTGAETYSLMGIDKIAPGKEISVSAKTGDGKTIEFTVISRLDMPAEVEYFRNGGILQMVLRQLL